MKNLKIKKKKIHCYTMLLIWLYNRLIALCYNTLSKKIQFIHMEVIYSTIVSLNISVVTRHLNLKQQMDKLMYVKIQ